jgi:PncC family amidohydrolase
MTHSLDDLAQRVMNKAAACEMTVVTAESCTAGCLATLLADTEGAMDCFHGGIVSYSKENKVFCLGVSPALIAQHTAVSVQVAEAMARGALRCTPASLAVAITGVAGPEPDEDGNPVGEVCISVAGRDRGIAHRTLSLGVHPRDEIRRRAMREALHLIESFLNSLSKA